MLALDPNALYSKEDLAALLTPFGLSVDAFLDRVRPRKVFKSVYFGKDLLAALERAPAIKDRSGRVVVPSPGRRRPVQGKPVSGDPAASLLAEFGS